MTEVNSKLESFDSKSSFLSHDISVVKFASGPMAAIIGQRKAEYACQTSKLFTGQEALDWGLIDQLVSPEGKLFLISSNFS